jgi:cytochrome c biogenesis protein CcdA
MTGPIIGTLAGLAIVDSINPSVTAAHVWLLAKTRSIGMAFAFVIGVYLANFAGGALILTGVAKLHPPEWLLRALPILLGLGMWVAGAVAWRSAQPAPPGGRWSFIQKWTPLSAAGLAAVMTVTEMPTAAPYFAALALIGPGSDNLGWLALYNALFVAPLIAIALVFATNRSRMSNGLNWVNARLVPFGTKITAVVLFVLGACFLWQGLSE